MQSCDSWTIAVLSLLSVGAILISSVHSAPQRSKFTVPQDSYRNTNSAGNGHFESEEADIRSLPEATLDHVRFTRLFLLLRQLFIYVVHSGI